jgi:hypothetical protein
MTGSCVTFDAIVWGGTKNKPKRKTSSLPLRCPSMSHGSNLFCECRVCVFR